MMMESMSKNIIAVMQELSKNEGLARLLVNDVSNPFVTPVPNKSLLINPTSEYAKIFPYPFDVDATVEDGSFLRVYYNNGDFNENETIAESQIHIDIVVAKSLWLINDGARSMIRAYEIMGRIKELIGTRSNNSTIKLEIKSYQHLYINTKFDCMRLYCEYYSVET